MYSLGRDGRYLLLETFILDKNVYSVLDKFCFTINI